MRALIPAIGDADPLDCKTGLGTGNYVRNEGVWECPAKTGLGRGSC